MEIKFGTDGWRAIIAKDFTFANLSKVCQATASWIKDEEITSNGVVIGHDARFMGREFSEFAASVFASLGIPVRFADSMATTPALSWAALEYDAVGIVITASHNPPNYNGFKIKAPFGGPATPDQIEAVETRIQDASPDYQPQEFSELVAEGKINLIPLNDLYLDVIRDRIDVEKIKKSGLKIGHDPMYGVAQGMIKTLFPDQTSEIHADINPGFHGTAPEPILKNLQPFAKFVKENDCDLGIANDGDADRVGLFDENGNFVDSHLVLSLLAKYLSQEKGFSGTIVKTFSTTSMLNKQAKKYDLPIETTKIGFKYIADKIVTGDVLLGGEESGGLAVKGHIPERDGIFIGLIIAEMMMHYDKPLSAMVEDLFDEFGPHHNIRLDIYTTDAKKQAMIQHCNDKQVKKINGKQVIKWEFTDGIKHWMEDGSWVLVRPSGTEPVLRIYSEDRSQDVAQQNAEFVSSMVDSF